MGEFFPAQVFKQLSHARAVIERHLAATLDTIHLFGSAIDGGLKPDSDIDLLVTVSAAPNDSLRQALMLDLLKVSSPPGDGGTWRPLELTVVARSEVVPWRYPARRELQFGEWLRHDILSGTFEPGHCCKVSDEAAFCLIQRPYISKTLLTRRISPRG
ncbi:aminoglycoside adenylyltransferase family protein, partial [Escherichia coli]